MALTGGSQPHESARERSGEREDVFLRNMPPTRGRRKNEKWRGCLGWKMVHGLKMVQNG